MKKNDKLFVMRYVPYSQRARSKRKFAFKTVLLSASACFLLAFASFAAASYLPKDIILKLVKNDGAKTAVQVEAPEQKLYIYPSPDKELRAKADRMREILLEEYREHLYTPGESELDNVYVYDNKRVCYLTFDDGPSEITERVLDVLDKYKVKATFFVTGVSARANPKLMKKIYKAGHSIGNHSMTHDYNSVYSSAEGFKSEILNCKEAINTAIGTENKNLIFRFPGGYGSLTDETTKASYTKVLRELGYKYTDWSCLTGDSNISDPTPEYLMETLKYGIGNTKTGDIVVLMHDSVTKKVTADTLPQIIEFLYSQGYKFDVLKN